MDAMRQSDLNEVGPEEVVLFGTLAVAEGEEGVRKVLMELLARARALEKVSLAALDALNVGPDHPKSEKKDERGEDAND